MRRTQVEPVICFHTSILQRKRSILSSRMQVPAAWSASNESVMEWWTSWSQPMSQKKAHFSGIISKKLLRTAMIIHFANFVYLQTTLYLLHALSFFKGFQKDTSRVSEACYRWRTAEILSSRAAQFALLPTLLFSATNDLQVSSIHHPAGLWMIP